MAQTVLPFKLEATEEMLTANAGLALFGEFAQGLGLTRWLAQEMPKPGSGRGYEAGAYVQPLILMLAGGGRSLEDLRSLKNDTALATVLKRKKPCPVATPLAIGCVAVVRRPDSPDCRASTSAWLPPGLGKAA